MWYSKNEAPFVVIQVKGNQVAVGWPHVDDSFSHVDKYFFQSCTYAPTAPDILRELGQDYRISYFPFRGGWVCEAAFPEVYANETNPAEACAEAWEVKQKAQ